MTKFVDREQGLSVVWLSFIPFQCEPYYWWFYTRRNNNECHSKQWTTFARRPFRKHLEYDVWFHGDFKAREGADAVAMCPHTIHSEKVGRPELSTLQK
jgi:hypothetical protein